MSCTAGDDAATTTEPSTIADSPTTGASASATVPVATSTAPTTSSVDVQDALEAAFANTCTSTDIPGASVAVVLPDESVWSAACGIASDAEAATPEHSFEIGSVTKTFTTALLLDLVADGLIQLDDPIEGLVPDTIPLDGVTVRHLLQHTSGLSDYTDDPELMGAMRADFARAWSPDELLNAFPITTLRPPGARWDYSNTNFILAGMVAESLTGEPAADLFRARLTEPNQLSRICLDGFEACSGPRAHAYLDIDDDGTPDDLTALVPNTSFITSAWTAGGLVATATDAAGWMRLHADGRLLPPAEFDELRTWIDRGDGLEYGLGLIRDDVDDVEWLGHKGNTAGFSASVWHAPEKRITVAVLTNAHLQDVTPIARSLLRSAMV